MFSVIQSLSIIKAKIVAGTVRGLKLLIPSMLDCLPHNQDEDNQFFGEDFLFIQDIYMLNMCSGLISTDNTLIPLYYINIVWPSWQRKSVFCSQKSLTYPLNNIILKPLLPESRITKSLCFLMKTEIWVFGKSIDVDTYLNLDIKVTHEEPWLICSYLY